MNDLFHTALTGRSLVRFAGPEAQAFLNGQLTCDVAGLPAARSTYGGYCTPKGRLLATFLLWAADDGYLLQLPQALREPIQKRLSMYVLRSKVKASDASADYVQYGIAGADARSHVAAVFGAVPAETHGVIRSERGGVLHLPLDRYLAVVPAAQAETVATALAQRLPAAPEPQWDALDVAAGIAKIVPETQEQFVPQMVNLDAIGGVSFSKGCYPGQEIVARMHYLGRLKERMYRARLDTRDAPHPGDRLYGVNLGEQAAGTIANAAVSGSGGCEVLAVVQRSSVAAGNLHWKALDGPRLELLDLPYSLPEK